MKTILSMITIFIGLMMAGIQAQQSGVLLHSFPAPPVGAQGGGVFGHSVAMDGSFMVVGAPNDDYNGSNAGVVKVFDRTTGALLHVIPNPEPTTNDAFGYAVAISDGRVVAGALGDDLGASNAGSAYVYDLGGGSPSVPVLTLRNPAPGVDDHFGRAVAISGSFVVVGAVFDDSGAADSGGAYAYDLDGATPTVPLAVLANPAPAASDYFGHSVAVSGSRVVVGAFFDDTGAANTGSAYVYDLAGMTPALPVLELHNPEPQSNDRFGISVAVSGPLVVVGANENDVAGSSNAGSAYIYDVSGGTPTVPVFTLNNPSPAINDEFGHATAIEGMKLVVGCWGDETGAANAGAVFVYDLAGAMPTTPAFTIGNPMPAVNDFFGWSVAINGGRLIVGAYGDDTSAMDAGTAFAYDIEGAAPNVPVLTLDAPTPAAGDLYGLSTAMDGKMVVVASVKDDTGAADTGAVHVHDLDSATPAVPVLTLNNPAPQGNDAFGHSVAISGKLVVVGVPWDDVGAVDAGTACVYDLSSVTPAVPVLVLNNPAPAVNDRFGFSVSISGQRVVVGTPNDDTDASDAGIANIYDLAGTMPAVPVHVLHNPFPNASDVFGHSVAISGATVVVGAHQDDSSALDAGSAYVYDLGGGAPTVPAYILNNPSPEVNERFGVATAISGSVIVVGVLYDNFSGPQAGGACVYDFTSAAPATPVLVLANPTPASMDAFGATVSISGRRIVVGAYGDDAGAADAGSACVFDLDSITPGSPLVSLSNLSPAEQEYFGHSVAISGSIVAVGAPYVDDVAIDKGYIYVFGFSPGAEDLMVSDDSIWMMGGAYAGDLYRPMPGVVNEAGQVAFKAFGIKGSGGIQAANDAFLMTDASGSLLAVAREGTVVEPGQMLTGLFNHLLLTEDGQAVALDRIDGASAAEDQATLVSPDGSMLEMLSREGDAAPGGGTFKLHTGKPAADAGSRVYFQCTLDGPASNKNTGVWMDEAGVLSAVIIEGADVGSVTGDDAWLGNIVARVAASDDGMAIIASLQNNPDDRKMRTAAGMNQAVLAGNATGGVLVARKGVPFADAGGALFKNFNTVARGGRNHAFLALLATGGGVTAANDQVLVADIGGVLHLVARERVTPVTGGLAVARFSQFYVTDSGEVIFKAYLDGASSATDGVLCRWSSAGGIAALAREGSSAVGTGANFRVLQTLSVSEGGALALTGTLSNGKSALWRVLPGGTPALVVQTGDTTTVNAVLRTIYALGIHATGTSSGGGGGMGAAVNSAGEVFTVLSLGSGDYAARIYR